MLREEHETLNIKLKEFSDDELKQVTSGTGENVNGTDGSGTINITIKDMSNRKSYYTVDPEITVYDLKCNIKNVKVTL